MNFYSFEDIKAAANCVTVAGWLGLELDRENRCAATWRGGTNPRSVSVSPDGWHDFSLEESGSALDLVAKVQFGGDMQQAQAWLGDRLGLQPTGKMGTISEPNSRYDDLLADGYREAKRYDYTDAAGKLVFQVVRLEHATKPKQFLQQAATGSWSVRHLPHPLYRLPVIAASEWAIVVEGEKDADTLAAWDLPGTTNAGGAKKWSEEHTAVLAGKDVVILPDNDDAGSRHFDMVAGALAGRVKSIRRVVVSSLPKGDVTDWRDKEGGSREKLLAMIAEAREIDQTRLSEPFAVAVAKEANQQPFRNYTLVFDGGSTTPRKEPRHLNDLIAECNRRFLGFPRKVGEELFDHDRDSGRICYLSKPPQLFAWMARKSGQLIDWARGTNFVGKDEFFEGVHAAAVRYEAISSVPDWPRREDVYYSHNALPEPSPEHESLRRLVSFFSGATPEDQALIAAFFLAPLFYRKAAPRPGWCLTSEAPGSGKTTLANALAALYGHPPVEVKTRDFARDMQEVTKRLVSPEGRQARVLLVDNVTGSLRSEELSGMMTMPYITGRPSYGRGEESRPNNLTYVITANNASVDNDLSIRLYFVQLKRVDTYLRTWEEELRGHIESHRWQIFADMLDLLERHEPFADLQPATRFPEFEARVLQACCGGADEYCRVAKALIETRAEANADEELGKAFEDVIRFNLIEIGIRPDSQAVWIRTGILDKWIGAAMPNLRFQSPSNMARDLARAGHLSRIHPHLRIWPHRGGERRRGLLWLADDPDKQPEIAVGERGGKAILLDESGRQTIAGGDI